jgi:hypothetical protein
MKLRPVWQGALLVMLALAVGTGIGLVAAKRSYSALIEVQGKSLVAQGEAIAALIGAGSAGPADAIPPERVAPLLRRLVPGPQTRARVYAPDGALLFDSGGLRHTASADARTRLEGWFLLGTSLPSRTSATSGSDAYPEVHAAITGSAPATLHLVENGEDTVSAAVPIFVKAAVQAVLLLSARVGS